MSSITGIDHLGIRVHDLEVSRKFYQKLGFKFLVGPVGPEPVAIMEQPSGIFLNLILNAAEPAIENQLMDVPVKYAGYTHVAFRVDSATAYESKLISLGFAITEGPVKFPTGVSLFIRDPDRNVIEFHEAAEVWGEMK